MEESWCGQKWIPNVEDVDMRGFIESVFGHKAGRRGYVVTAVELRCWRGANSRVLSHNGRRTHHYCVSSLMMPRLLV